MRMLFFSAYVGCPLLPSLLRRWSISWAPRRMNRLHSTSREPRGKFQMQGEGLHGLGRRRRGLRQRTAAIRAFQSLSALKALGDFRRPFAQPTLAGATFPRHPPAADLDLACIRCDAEVSASYPAPTAALPANCRHFMCRSVHI